MLKKVETLNAPEAVGPYSQAVLTGNLLFVSGQIPLTVDGILVEGGIEEQTRQVLANLEAILRAGGCGLESVVKTTVYLRNMADFSLFNQIYASYFSFPIKPARATIEVSRLPKNVLVEIDCIAVVLK